MLRKEKRQDIDRIGMMMIRVLIVMFYDAQRVYKLSLSHTLPLLYSSADKLRHFSPFTQSIICIYARDGESLEMPLHRLVRLCRYIKLERADRFILA